ncbi:hsp90 co-chaperone Cdc37-like 1 [Oncorhynchus mykiss]|uniref:Hsp90 co-chaperone Cdc37-like 1 n=1 Tax=Oncorhynchus mykiss TaxID=8022 RepID=A0A8K9UVU9_ONCMY|nr:hsp90 co-chaperone Cdc37-like 1 [Oncorhynchus mykiss]XP_036792827.1 hsp90 co-chaperone Cdc37-like 1 [Oncorhynchus mykiss]XP_036792828.1 hsp90 co-chaperone Cdc37-like 1 [Oncorhynchus mykiss]
MEWFGTGNSPMFPEEEEGYSASASSVPSSFHSSSLQEVASAESMVSLCQRQQQCVKASVSSWQLVEAQDQLCGMELHGSESVEQERARAVAGQSELSQTEHEWRRKESMLGGSRSPVLSADSSRDMFDKSIINSKNVELEVHDKSKTFVQKYEKELRHFGMLRRWDDSQRFLSDLHHLICEETANYLILWCFRLQAEEKEALMEQVAHQAVAMQFILEMASTSQQDPRGCFRHFFHKAKAGQEGYLNVFHAELEAFKQRVKEYTVKFKGETLSNDTPLQSSTARCHLDPKEVLESLPPELKAGFQLQDMQILQNVLRTMNPQVAEYHVKRCLESGLWTNKEGRRSKEEVNPETDDLRMMET